MQVKKRHIPQALDAAFTFYQQGAVAQAGDVLRSILKADRRQAESLHLLGFIEGQSGCLVEAEQLLQRAVKAAPDIPDYHNSLGVVLRKLGRLRDAERSYQRCLKLQPDHLECLDNLGTLLRHDNRPQDAERYCRRAYTLRSSDKKLQANLAGALAEQGRFEEPVRLFMQVLESPDRNLKQHALASLMKLAITVCDFTWYHQLHQQMLDTVDANYSLNSYLLLLSYLDEMSNDKIAEIHRELTPRLTKRPLAEEYKHPGCTSDKKPLRIGYISPDLVVSSVGFLLEPIVCGHDAHQITTIVYDVHTGSEKELVSIREACGLWHDCRSLSDEVLVSLIRQDAIDILVDLSGHNQGNRLAVFAARCAPVQVTWLGYWNTTGMPQMDWLISDTISTPKGEERFFTERIWRMPYFRYAVRLKSFCSPEPTMRTAGEVTFVSYNNPGKLTPKVLAAWAEILRQLPGSVLLVRWKSLVSEEQRHAFRDRFTLAGGNEAQLKVLDALVHDELMESYASVDIMLDSFPFSGGITSLDALTMGVPVITLASDRMAGRQTKAFLKHSGQLGLVAETYEEYIRIAVDLANAPERLYRLRQTLRNDLETSPLCDVRQFVTDLEEAYRGMWQDYCVKSKSACCGSTV